MPKKIRRFVRFHPAIEAMATKDFIRREGQDGVMKLMDAIDSVAPMDVFQSVKFAADFASARRRK